MAIGPRQKNVVMKAPAQLIYVVDIDRLVHTSLDRVFDGLVRRERRRG